jgi:hypothetical protein
MGIRSNYDQLMGVGLGYIMIHDKPVELAAA